MFAGGRLAAQLQGLGKQSRQRLQMPLAKFASVL
jgi:hypothetical protein